VIGKTLAELTVGDAAEIVRRVEMADIRELVNAVGDHNPIHADARFAAQTSFGEPIAPGVFTAGLISAVIGTQLPGPGAIYLSQSLKFLRPVKVGDTITARAEVVEIVSARQRIRLSTVCRNQRGEDVLSGEAWVMPSPTPVRYVAAPAGLPVPAALALHSWAWATAAMTAWGRLGLSMLTASLLTSAARR
jgi:acyl dehydratase